jgi:signal peptidase I
VAGGLVQSRVQSRVRVPKATPWRGAVEWVVIVLGALCMALVVKTFLIQAFYIPSLSMSPTLEVNDRVLVNKLSYDLHEVNRGDVVVFHSPSEEPGESKDLIKRVVGLPGDSLESRNGYIVVNGRRLEEPYLQSSEQTGELEPITVPAGHVFVMGDNRDNSSDSRVFGAVDESLIVGRAFVKVWPITQFTTL